MATALVDFRKAEERMPEFLENILRIELDEWYVSISTATGSHRYPRDVILGVHTEKEETPE